MKLFARERELGRGWSKVTVNRIDIKVKIINVFLATRKDNSNRVYDLDQGRILAMRAKLWGGDSWEDNTAVHPNNRVRVIGLIILINIH